MNHISFLPKFFHIDYPEALSKELLKCKNNAEVEQVGIEWGIQQSKELKEANVPGIHYYTMSNSNAIYAIAKEIFRTYEIYFIFNSHYFIKLIFYTN